MICVEISSSLIKKQNILQLTKFLIIESASQFEEIIKDMHQTTKVTQKIDLVVKRINIYGRMRDKARHNKLMAELHSNLHDTSNI